MRKFSVLTTLFVAAAISAASIGASAAVPAPKRPAPLVRNADHAGQWAVGCGFASSGSLMIGTAIHAGDKKDPRQLTITEAGWHSAACPFLLPWALIGQALCPDNKATYQVARLAFRFVKKHGPGDQSAFTNAYGEACRTGNLSRDTLRRLNGLI
jgi:hypothetical protein